MTTVSPSRYRTDSPTAHPAQPVRPTAPWSSVAPVSVPTAVPVAAPRVDHLLSPMAVRGMTVRNRVVMPPMGTNFAGPDGSLLENHIAYYEQRARGGVGLIVVENSCVSFPAGGNGTSQLRIDHDSFVPRLWELTERLHRHGAKAALQLNHAGASANPARTGVPALSSSDQPTKPGGTAPIPVPMTHAQIAQVVRDFGTAARRAKTAGFDAVELHAGHGYLLCQFLSPLYNLREDEYGGSPVNRARIMREVLAEVRRQVGPGFPVMVRISADEMVAGGNTLEDSVELMRHFVDEVDVIDVSAALSTNPQYQIDRMDLADGWRAPMARRFREAFGLPTITSGNVRDPEVAERIVADGDSDLVAIGRGLIADPWWVSKVVAGQADTILACISCNTGCSDHRIRLDRPIRCAINPDIIEHEAYRSRRVRRPVKVVVIGGGVGGLEAACTAAEVGCEVVLLEGREALGGTVGEAVRLPAKRRIATFLAHLARRAARAGVEVRLGTWATVDHVRAEHPDLVVNATGSTPSIPPIPGLRERIDADGSPVHSIFGLAAQLEDLPDLRDRSVVVVGAGAVGLDVVEHAVALGARVTLVERLDAVGPDLDIITRLQMLEMIDKHDVEVLTRTSLDRVADDHVQVTGPDGAPRTIGFDRAVVCLGMRAVDGLYADLRRDLAGERVELLTIGDAVSARRIIEATREGRDVLVALERLGAL